jgi:hypothetical protein
MLHIPLPSGRRGVFVTTLLAVPCSGFGLTFSLRVGSRRATVSGQEVRTGGEVVEASPGVWWMSSGVASKRGLGTVSCGDSFDPVLPRVSCLIRLPEFTTSSLALFLLLVFLEPDMQSGQVGVGWSCHCSYCRPQLHRCRVTTLVVASPIATIQFLAWRMWICCRKSISQLRTAYSALRTV